MGLVYNCCWSSPADTFWGPSPAGLMTIFYCIIFETPPTWRARSPYLGPPGTEWPSYTPGTGLPFRRLLRLAGLRRRYSQPSPHGFSIHCPAVKVKVKVMLWPTVSRSVGQSVLVSSTHLRLTNRFLLLPDSCGFVDVGRSLWWDKASAAYNCC
jgi:hypothetical protein